MLRRDRQLRAQLNQYIDGCVFAFGLWLGWLINHWVRLGPDGKDPIGPFYGDYFWLFLVVIPLTPLVLEWQGFYERPYFSPVKEMAWQLARSCAYSAIALILIEFMLKRPGARAVFVLFGFCSFGLMFLKEELLRLGYKTKLGQEQFRRRIVLAGVAEDTQRLRADVARQAEDLEVVGEFDLASKTIEDLVVLLHEHSVNAVVLAVRHAFFEKAEKAIRVCELEGIEIWLLADFFRTEISETSLDHFYGRPVLVFRCGTGSSWPRLLKQVIDLLGAMVGLVIALPFLVAAAVAIKLTSRGPVLFRQARAGLNGKPFTMYKFRSMVTNAEQLKQELERLNEMSGPVFKVTNDPRVTKVGRLLRKTSIDEWPQLFNVLRFEMSLVGPRPLPVDEVQRFDDVAHRRRLSVKPGITCTWQVSGRNDVKDFKDWVRMDLEYIDNWSLWLDIKILWRTIWVVLLGKGAR
jgi:exopolysaccharide biosynthesis polyprenyl glycosylphosphotransferase